MTADGERTNPWAAVIYSRAFANGDPTLVQVQFHASVLEHYRESGLEIKRTNTAGRVKKAGGWSLDFGIGERELTIHAGVGELMRNLPKDELRHWAEHVVQPGLSENFCKMQLHGGSCIDDGDLRDW